MGTASSTSTTPLSILDLVSQTTDGATELAKKKFIDLIFYAMGDWREKLFAAPQPDILPAEVQIVSDNQQLYSDSLCDAYILKQLSQLTPSSGGPSTPIWYSDQDKLNYFWQRTVAALQGYSDVGHRLTQTAWITTTPRIQDCLNDASQDWANLLYNALTTIPALDQAALAYIGSGFSMTQVNLHCEMLLALSPKRTQTMGENIR